MLDPDDLLAALIIMEESGQRPGKTRHGAMIKRTAGMQFVDGPQRQSAAQDVIDHRDTERQPMRRIAQMPRRQHATQIWKSGQRFGHGPIGARILCSLFVLHGSRVFGLLSSAAISLRQSNETACLYCRNAIEWHVILF
jgi:hypothetical protein